MTAQTLCHILMGVSWIVANSVQMETQVAELARSQEMRIDGVREDLVTFTTVRIGPRGRLLLPQEQDGNFILFDSSGKRMSVIGRRGQGPGEFESIGSYGWLGDTIWVWDSRSYRLQHFTSDGSLLRSTPLRAIRSSNTAVPTLHVLEVFAMLPDHSFVVRGVTDVADPRARNSPLRGAHFALVGEDQTLIRFLSRVPERGAIAARQANGSQSAAAVPFRFADPHDINPFGTRIGFVRTSFDRSPAGHYRLILLGITTDTILARPYSFRGDPIPGRVADSAITATLARLSNLELRALYQRSARAQVPPAHAPVQQLLLGRDGTVWLRMRTSDGRHRWLGLDSRGNEFGTMSLPSHARLVQAERGRVWVIETNADGVRSVLRLALR